MKNNAQFPDVNEVATNDEVFYHVFMEREGIESNEFEDDDVGWSESTDSEDSEESNEDDINAILLMFDDEEVLVERTHPTHFYVEDQRPYFSLGMTFPNASEVRKYITKYCITRGVTLKYVKNERNRIRVKYEDQCPFVLLVSKDNNNLGLVVKTLVPNHNYYRIFSNPKVSVAFLAQHYKTTILENHDYKIKDMKKDADEEYLRVNVGHSKCKRARRVVLDAYSKAFTTKFPELEAYANELLRNNPSSIVKVEIFRDGLKEGMRIFKIIFVFFLMLITNDGK